MSPLVTIDWVIIGVYFAIVFAIAWWAYRKQAKGGETSAGYFLAGRHVGWFVVGASLFVSNIGAEHLVGLAGTGADSGVAVAQFEILAAFALLLLGWVFVPFYIKSAVFTMPEFLERRYSPAARLYLSLISIAAYVLTKISVTIYAGGIVFEAIMPGGFWTGAVAVIIATGVYTVMGGLRAVVYTDFMQMFVILVGYTAVLIVGLVEIGGWGELRASVEDRFFDMWRPVDAPSFPWTGIVFGAPILGIWYWCTDQFIVQRTLAAKDQDHARRGSILAGYLKLLPLFIFVLPGIVAHALAQDGRIQLEQSDQALPTLIGQLLPAGMRGLVVAGLLAALMSSLSSVFNSCSTLITEDIYKKLRPGAPERRLVWVGRVATVGLVGLSLAWVPLMENISQRLYEYLQSVQAYIAPPITAVFLLGVAWPRINATGAMASLLTGFVLGAARLILELIHGAGQKGLPEGSVWAAVAEFNFLHFAAVLFAVSVAILVGVSLVTARPPRDKVAGLTYRTAEEEVRGRPEQEQAPALTARPAWRRRDLVLSAGLALLVALVWIYFS